MSLLNKVWMTAAAVCFCFMICGCGKTADESGKKKESLAHADEFLKSQQMQTGFDPAKKQFISVHFIKTRKSLPEGTTQTVNYLANKQAAYPDRDDYFCAIFKSAAAVAAFHSSNVSSNGNIRIQRAEYQAGDVLILTKTIANGDEITESVSIQYHDSQWTYLKEKGTWNISFTSSKISAADLPDVLLGNGLKIVPVFWYQEGNSAAVVMSAGSIGASFDSEVVRAKAEIKSKEVGQTAKEAMRDASEKIEELSKKK